MEALIEKKNNEKIQLLKMEYSEIASIIKEIDFLKSLSLSKMKRIEPTFEINLKDEVFKKNYKKAIIYEIEEKINKIKDLAKMLYLEDYLEKKVSFFKKMKEFIANEAFQHEILLKIMLIVFMLAAFYAINKDKKIFNYLKREN